KGTRQKVPCPSSGTLALRFELFSPSIQLVGSKVVRYRQQHLAHTRNPSDRHSQSPSSRSIGEVHRNMVINWICTGRARTEAIEISVYEHFKILNFSLSALAILVELVAPAGRAFLLPH